MALRIAVLAAGVLAAIFGIVVVVSWALGASYESDANASLQRGRDKSFTPASVQRAFEVTEGAYAFGPALSATEWGNMAVTYDSFTYEDQRARTAKNPKQRASYRATANTRAVEFEEWRARYQTSMASDSPAFAGMMILALIGALLAFFRLKWLGAPLLVVAALAPWFLDKTGTPALMSLWLLLPALASLFIKKKGSESGTSKDARSDALFARSEAEINLYKEVNPCECDSMVADFQTVETQDGEWTVRTMSGPCRGCGKIRTFKFRFRAPLMPGNPHESFGDGPSKMIDPGQFGVWSDSNASSMSASPEGMSDQELQNSITSLRRSITGLVEVCKFYTGTDPMEELPASIFTSRIGKAYYDSLPGQFRRMRIEARLGAYRELLPKFESALAAKTAGGRKPIQTGPPPGAMTIDIVYHTGQVDRAMYGPDEATRLLNDFLGFVNNGEPTRGTYYLLDVDFVSFIPLEVDFYNVSRVSTL